MTGTTTGQHARSGGTGESGEQPPSAGSGTRAQRSPQRRDHPRRLLGIPETGPARWVLALAVVGSVMAAAPALGNVFLDTSWFPPALLVVVFTAFLPALIRRYPRLALYAPIAALAGWSMGLTLVFFPATAYVGLIPSAATVRAAVNLTGEAASILMVSNAPVPTENAIIFVICAGLGFAAMLVDTLAITVALPAASAFGLVLILLPSALTTQDGLSVLSIVGAAIGYMLILGCCRWYAPDGKPRPGANRAASGTLRRALVLGTAVVLVIGVLPGLIPGFTSGTFPQGSRLGHVGNVGALDPMISLGNDLRSQSNSVNMTYLTSAPGSLYMRMSTLEDFTGKTWKPSAVPENLSQDMGTLAPTFGPNTAVPRTTTTTWVSLAALSTNWLPSPLRPTKVEGLSGSWTWEPSTETIHGDALTSQKPYQVTSDMPGLTPDLLRAATQKPNAGLDPVFTKLPDNMPGIISKTVKDVTVGKNTPYDRALAISDYLRSGAFTYSEKTPVEKGYDGAGMNVIAKFLEVKAGYCVHFSATMAVMAREVGIPSRIVVGFAPGSQITNNVSIDGVTLQGYQATGRDAHAWPELYFEGLGWVPFEPTPSRGVVPSYAVASVAPVTSQNNSDLLNGADNRPDASSGATDTATATAAAADPLVHAPETPPQSRFRTVLLVLLLALLALASPAVTRALVRRRRLALIRGTDSGRADSARNPRPTPEELAWRELLATATDYGYRRDLALTPALQGAHIAVMLGASTEHDVEVIRTAYEKWAFAPHAAAHVQTHGRSAAPVPGVPGVPGSRADLADALERINASLQSGAITWIRVRAALLPSSLWYRSH